MKLHLAKCNILKERLINGCRNLLRRKLGGESNFLAVLILFVICIVIGVLLKDTLSTTFSNVLGKVDTNINGLFP